MLKFFKRPYIIIFILSVLFILPSCVKTTAGDDDGRLTIVATLFPQYDFARQIAGDKADVVLLLPPGTESHSFDPKPSDMLKINNADLFIYTGKDMEPWAESLIKGITNKNLVVVDCSENIELLQTDDADEHDHGADPHIWLDPDNSIKMCENITRYFIEKDPDNSDFYTKNCSDYIKRLQKLDEDISDVISNAKRNVIVFGGRFSYIYFLTHFNLDYITAYDSCSVNAEPSVSRIAEVIDFIKKNNIPCIYYEELSDPKVAKTIAEETGIECLLFSTAHNITKDEFDGGVTFLDIMYANLENLKKGLN